MAAEALGLRERGLGPAACLAQVDQRQGLCGTLRLSHMPCLRGRGSTFLGCPRPLLRDTEKKLRHLGLPETTKVHPGKVFYPIFTFRNREYCFALPCVSACLYIWLPQGSFL